MTTGSWSTGALNFSRAGTSKSWSGSDGKYQFDADGRHTVFHNYSMNYVKQSSNPGVGGPDYYVYCGGNPSSIYSLWSSNDDLALLSKLNHKISQFNTNLAVDVATGKQTVEMTLGVLNSFRGAIRSLKKGDFTGAARHLGVPMSKRREARLSSKDIAGRWLEMQYGWLPLCSDVYDVWTSYANLNSKRVMRFVASSTKRGYNNDDSQAPFTWETLGVTRYSKRIIAIIDEENSFARELGLYDPASIAWEIIPYSFVVDWFLPIGEWLSLLGQIPSLQGRFCTTTYIIYDATSQPYLPFNKLGGYNGNFSGAFQQYRRVIVQRDPSSSLSVPLPSFNPLPNAMSPHRIYNAVSLLRQVF